MGERAERWAISSRLDGTTKVLRSRAGGVTQGVENYLAGRGRVVAEVLEVAKANRSLFFDEKEETRLNREPCRWLRFRRALVL